jgi:hydrogenase maturation protease
MARILIIGYGNPLRSDDGLGWRAAEELAESDASPDVEVVTCHQLTPELADDLHLFDAAIFIDAARSGYPGDLTCGPVISKPENIHSHQLSPAGVLALAQQIYGAAPKAFAASLCGECFDHGTTLSATVDAALPSLIALVEELTAQIQQESGPAGKRV